MKKILIFSYIFLSIFGLMGASSVYAFECQPGYVENAQSTGCQLENVLGLKSEDLRTGNVNMNSISQVIVNITNALLGVAGTVAIVALIYYAVQMQLNSGITGDSSGVDKAKKGMTGALIGFVIAILAWFIVIQFIKTLSQLS